MVSGAATSVFSGDLSAVRGKTVDEMRNHHKKGDVCMNYTEWLKKSLTIIGEAHKINIFW